MEIYELWAAQIRSLVRSQPTPISESVSNAIFIFTYLLALFVSNTRQLRLSFLFMVLCIFVSNSIMYDALNGYQLHLVYSAIYLFGAKQVRVKKVIIALCIMAWFDLGMAWDAYRDAETETWLSSNYVNLTACVHGAIIAVCIDWRRTISRINDCIDNLRHLWLNNCYFLYL